MVGVLPLPWQVGEARSSEGRPSVVVLERPSEGRPSVVVLERLSEGRPSVVVLERLSEASEHPALAGVNEI
jgi:hypothetical protein